MNATLGSRNFRVPTCKQSQLSPQNYNKEEVTRPQPLTLCRVPNTAPSQSQLHIPRLSAAARPALAVMDKICSFSSARESIVTSQLTDARPVEAGGRGV